MTVTVLEQDIKQAIADMLLKTTGNRVRAEHVHLLVHLNEESDGSVIAVVVEVETKGEP